MILSTGEGVSTASFMDGLVYCVGRGGEPHEWVKTPRTKRSKFGAQGKPEEHNPGLAPFWMERCFVGAPQHGAVIYIGSTWDWH
jgi:hypothetical protein